MIQLQQRPLSQPDKDALNKVLTSAGFQRLKDIVLSRQAEAEVNAARQSVENADDGIDANTSIERARFCRNMYLELLAIEAADDKGLWLAELKVQPE